MNVSTKDNSRTETNNGDMKSGDEDMKGGDGEMKGGDVGESVNDKNGATESGVKETGLNTKEP